MCGSSFLHTKEIAMGDIQDALGTFQKMMDYKYKFEVSHKRTAYAFELSFEEKDFRHMAGLHYLSDIDIPKTPKTLFEKIRNEKIIDKYLGTSVNYTKVQDSYANVQSRIYGLKYLERYLDNNNLICKYVKYMNLYSNIDADYMIKSTIEHRTAYIFLKKRKQKESYCICSFFIEAQREYKGIGVYWLYKSKIKIEDNKEEVLYNRLNKGAVH